MTSRTLRSLHLLTAAAALLCGAVACSSSGSASKQSGPNQGGVDISVSDDNSRFAGAEPGTPYAMPDVTLEATNAEPFNLVTDTAYPVTLVFFGYTNCPDVCPLVMSDLTAAVVQLPDEVRAQTQVLFVTTDPARDTPEVLRPYLDHYDEDFVGLTGHLHDIEVAADSMGVAIEGRQRLPSGGYEVGHGAQVIGFSGNEAPVIWTQGTPVPDMAHDIVELAGP